MFEHMKNYKMLLAKIASWLRPAKNSATNEESLLFVHIFCHKSIPYHFEEGNSWMANNFFTGQFHYIPTKICWLTRIDSSRWHDALSRSARQCFSLHGWELLSDTELYMDLRHISRMTSRSSRPGTSTVNITREQQSSGFKCKTKMLQREYMCWRTMRN